jgi:hypothetical protein
VVAVELGRPVAHECLEDDALREVARATLPDPPAHSGFSANVFMIQCSRLATSTDMVRSRKMRLRVTLRSSSASGCVRAISARKLGAGSRQSESASRASVALAGGSARLRPAASRYHRPFRESRERYSTNSPMAS